jgi:uroporphyrinogen-III synthase
VPAPAWLVSVYQRAEPHWSAAEQAVLDDALARPRQHAWLLSSAESVAQLAARVGPVLQGQRAIATHARIAAAARAAGFEPVVLTRPDPAEVAQALRGL